MLNLKVYLISNFIIVFSWLTIINPSIILGTSISKDQPISPNSNVCGVNSVICKSTLLIAT